MATLRDYLYGYDEGGAVVPQELVVYNTNTTTVNNGGACCEFIVPGDKTVVAWEIWGGGGAGAGGQCCTIGMGADAGGYIAGSKTVSPGDTLIICAAGSTCCRSTGSCQNGFDSYVCLNGEWCARAQGGCHGWYQCNGHYCYRCCGSLQTTPVSYNGDSHNVMCIQGNKGFWWSNSYCYNHGFSVQPGAPMTGHMSMGINGCCTCSGAILFGHFPGGGGFTAGRFGGSSNCGGAGAGGMVYLVFR